MFARFSTILCFAVLASFVTAEAAVMEIVTAGSGVASAALLGKSVKQILNDAHLAASGILAQGQRTGNDFVIRGADEINASADAAIRIFESKLDKKFDDLDEKERKALLGLAQATDAAEKLAKQAYTFKDTTALDVKAVLGNLPLVSETITIQRIDGLSQLNKSGDYKLRVIGSYVGLGDSDHKAEIKLKIGGAAVKDARIDPLETHITEIVIPTATLEPYFQVEKVAVVDADLVVTHSIKKSFLGIGYTRRIDSVSPLHLVLYPNYTGELTVTVEEPRFDWVDAGPVSIDQTGPYAHCSSNCKDWYGIDWSFDKTVAGGNRFPHIANDMRITNVTCSHVSGEGAQFDVIIGPSIQDSETRARCSLRARTQVTIYRLTAWRQQWRKVEDLKSDTDARFFFDCTIEVRIPKDAASVRVHGKTILGDAFDFISTEVNPKLQLQVVGRQENTSDLSLFLRMPRPQGID